MRERANRCPLTRVKIAIRFGRISRLVQFSTVFAESVQAITDNLL